MQSDAATSRFLYTILKQLDHKSIDWNTVASDLEITNGHAARMRFSRFRQHMEGIPPTPRKPRSEGRPHKKAKTERTAKQEPKHESNQLPIKTETMLPLDSGRARAQPGCTADATAVAKVKLEHSIISEPIVKGETLIKEEPSIKEEPMEDFAGDGGSNFAAPPSGHTFVSQKDTSSDSTTSAQINGNPTLAMSREHSEERSDHQSSHAMDRFVKVEPTDGF